MPVPLMWGYSEPSRLWLEDPEDAGNVIDATLWPTIAAQAAGMGRHHATHADELVVLADRASLAAWVLTSPLVGCLRDVAGVWRTAGRHGPERQPSPEDLWCRFRPMPRPAALAAIIDAAAAIAADGCWLRVTPDELRARYAVPTRQQLAIEAMPIARVAEDGRALITAGPAMGWFRGGTPQWHAPGFRPLPVPAWVEIKDRSREATPAEAAQLTSQAMEGR
jgi:hypothetical protein